MFDPENYKVRLCKDFERDGYCRYEDRCVFIGRNV